MATQNILDEGIWDLKKAPSKYLFQMTKYQIQMSFFQENFYPQRKKVVVSPMDGISWKPLVQKIIEWIF